MTTTMITLDLFEGDGNDLDDLLDRAAGDVHRYMVSGKSAPGGDVDDLTNYLLGFHIGQDDATTVASRTSAALVELVKGRMRGFIMVDCLLDETAQASYDAADSMAATLVDAIRAQDNEYGALVNLVTHEIWERCTNHYADNCPACGKVRRRIRGAEHALVDICLNTACPYDK